ncbi:5-formyltetrahydrofolate cyclo-ligase [Anaplasma capra]|uniref:5-formyltetrahydrofolate cyclo-ligase n=1 Tax=Anaplasma capra TaxID=1562740 RepID=UPI0037C0266D
MGRVIILCEHWIDFYTQTVTMASNSSPLCYGDDDAMQEKQLLRSHYRSLRRNISNVYEAAEMLKNNCIRNVKIKRGGIVAGYIPMDGEIDILPLLKFAEEQGSIVLVPVIEKGSRILAFKRWNDDTVDERASIPQILFVPLVAFDRNLNRLGFGGGYYDCTISFLRKNFRCQCIGVAYNAQLCSKIPTVVHDQRLDLIVTEDTVYKG